MSKAFQKPKFYQNLTSGSGSKQRFSLLQEKAVIQAVCLRPQTVSINPIPAGVLENQDTLGGGQFDPPL